MVAAPAKAAEPKPIKVTLPPSPPPPVLTKAPSDVRWLTDLGVVYFRQHQFHEAYLCFRRTAEQNFAPAQFCLAVCYLNGQGTAQDEAAALPWLRRAAAQGDTNAEFTLGMAYRLGRGVPPNEELAQQWLRQAAGQGHREAIRLVVGTEGGNASTQIKAAAPPPPVPVPVVSEEKAPPSKLRQDLQRMLLGLFRKK
jgi:TPR repeat protein